MVLGWGKGSGYSKHSRGAGGVGDRYKNQGGTASKLDQFRVSSLLSRVHYSGSLSQKAEEQSAADGEPGGHGNACRGDVEALEECERQAAVSGDSRNVGEARDAKSRSGSAPTPPSH